MTEQVVEGEVVHEQALDRAEQIRDTLPAVRASEALVARDEITVGDVVAQREKIIAVMDAVMVEGVHYGRIPGVDKPTLLKPGAEVLAVTFRLGPFYNSERLFHDDGHLTVITKTTLRHIPTSLAIAEGEGLCTTREAKYAWRKGGLVCPDCGEPQIRKSKHDPEFYCWRKEGGCGSKFPLDDERITSQDQSSRIPNPDIADTYNTVLKIANKRALVAAILNGTAASDVFTQDVEDGGSSDSTSTAKTPTEQAPPKISRARKKKQADIEDLFREADRRRGEKLGTTWREAQTVREFTIADMPEVDLDELGQRLGHFVYQLTAEQMNERGFAPYYEDVPFS